MECRVGLNKNIDESVLQWFAYIERMRNDRISKWVYVKMCVGSILIVDHGRGGLIQ